MPCCTAHRRSTCAGAVRRAVSEKHQTIRQVHTQLVFVCDRRDLVMGQKTGAAPIHVELDVALGAERRVGSDGDTEQFAIVDRAF